MNWANVNRYGLSSEDGEIDPNYEFDAPQWIDFKEEILKQNKPSEEEDKWFEQVHLAHEPTFLFQQTENDEMETKIFSSNILSPTLYGLHNNSKENDSFNEFEEEFMDATEVLDKFLLGNPITFSVEKASSQNATPSKNFPSTPNRALSLWRSPYSSKTIENSQQKTSSGKKKGTSLFQNFDENMMEELLDQRFGKANPISADISLISSRGDVSQSNVQNFDMDVVDLTDEIERQLQLAQQEQRTQQSFNSSIEQFSPITPAYRNNNNNNNSIVSEAQAEEHDASHSDLVLFTIQTPKKKEKISLLAPLEKNEKTLMPPPAKPTQKTVLKPQPQNQQPPANKKTITANSRNQPVVFGKNVAAPNKVVPKSQLKPPTVFSNSPRQSSIQTKQTNAVSEADKKRKRSVAGSRKSVTRTKTIALQHSEGKKDDTESQHSQHSLSHKQPLHPSALFFCPAPTQTQTQTRTPLLTISNHSIPASNIPIKSTKQHSKPLTAQKQLEAEVKEMLSGFKEFKPKSFYEPRKFGPKEIKMWEKFSGKKWETSSPNERAECNSWIEKNCR